jgi:hypothetical protein
LTRIKAQPELFPLADQTPIPNATNFVDNMQQPVHRWFRYSAGFSGEWVERLVKEAGTPTNVRVLDPFAGSGTTMLAAQFAGAVSMGLDSHPFVSRVGKAKLLWTEDPHELRRRAASVLDRFKPSAPTSPPPKLLLSCYTPDALAELIGLRDAVCRARRDDNLDALLWLAFVAIVRPVSHVGTAQWQYVLPNKRSRARGVRASFQQQIDVMATDMSWRQLECPSPVKADYSVADARCSESFPERWATHVICSPPYANNYDYADATRLEQTVLGEVESWGDLKAVRSSLLRSCSQHMVKYDPSEAFEDPILQPILSELQSTYAELAEAKGQHAGKKAYHHMIVAYFHDLAHVWTGLRKACVNDAKVCFVIGDSAPYGIYVPVERWLGELALAAGFKSWRFEKVRDRNLKWKNRKHRVPLHEGRLWVEG